MAESTKCYPTLGSLVVHSGNELYMAAESTVGYGTVWARLETASRCLELELHADGTYTLILLEGVRGEEWGPDGAVLAAGSVNEGSQYETPKAG